MRDVMESLRGKCDGDGIVKDTFTKQQCIEIHVDTQLVKDGQNSDCQGGRIQKFRRQICMSQIILFRFKGLKKKKRETNVAFFMMLQSIPGSNPMHSPICPLSTNVKIH